MDALRFDMLSTAPLQMAADSMASIERNVRKEYCVPRVIQYGSAVVQMDKERRVQRPIFCVGPLRGGEEALEPSYSPRCSRPHTGTYKFTNVEVAVLGNTILAGYVAIA
jgi:hypothetical protein